MTVAIFGKLRSQPDFYRHGQLSPAVSEAERWLQEAYEAVRGAGKDLTPAPFAFVLARPSWKEVVIAAGVGSVDSVGRSFPLAAFVTADAAAVAGRGWAIPVVYGSYLEELQRLLVEAAEGGDGNGLLEGLSQLPPMPSSVFDQADNQAVQLVNAQTIDAFEGRLFDQADARFYAYRTLRMACDQVKQAGVPDQNATVLGCPIGADVDVVAWAAMAIRILAWPIVLPMIWSRAPTSRLMIALGPLPSSALRFLLDEGADSMRLWPLTTTSDAAITAAREALISTASWGRGGEPLAALFERVATFVV